MEAHADLGTADRVTPRSALLAKGFRPFFLLAAVWAIVAVPLWLVVQAGGADLGVYLVPADWHAHEMVFGFSVAVVAGFLLTAAANWTQRETATGALLLGLCVLWIAGRVALLASGVLPPALVATISLAFLPVLAIVIGRVIVLAKSKRNYGIVLVLAALFAAQLLTHVGALQHDLMLERRGSLLGVDLILVLIAVVGGRVIPLFTRNATKASDIESNAWVDRAAIASVAVAGLADVLLLSGPALAAIMAVAAVLNALRMRRWGVQHTLREPLLWVLHVGYFFLPIGLALRAVAELTPHVQASAALHATTVGAIGVLTLGMMARVSLGHTGRAIVAPKAITVAFVLVILAAIVRVVGPMIGGRVSTPSLHAAATLWSLAFLLYVARIAPVLVAPRPDGRPG